MILGRPSLLESNASTASTDADITHTGPEINLIPFIDVLLVILIFLMISTTFTQYQELSITLPSVAGEHAAPLVKEIRIAVSRDGKYAVNGNLAETNALASRINALKTQLIGADEQALVNLRVVISADAKASHESVMQVLEIASNAGLSNIVFATQNTSTPDKKR
jgi:biopolymer transport protein ExbD